MRTASLRINELSPAASAWYLDYLAALDAKDVGRYGAFLADGVVMQTNNGEPVRGKAAVLAALAAYWATFGTLEHDLRNVYGTDRSFVLEALNHYTRRDGSAVTLRAAAFTDRDPSGLVASVRLYTDTAPLFGPG